ncbi:tryptophan decarboxylase-like [Saccoglossus kowalevskii]|uniref:Tyrosine decarboxylase 1-like n=1 Tax=Saccoglossus kowalevskii TaxID=10224 RepID=A0ABM0LVV3_SACKO|nr:PREDICTED: tyrosine decarboxylase 1-like [Saccoglossus kowalevskii]
MEYTQRLNELETHSRRLDSGAACRKEWINCVVEYSENFLDNLSRLNHKTIHEDNPSDDGITQYGITDKGSNIGELVNALDTHVFKNGLESAHANYFAFVSGGALFPSALGDLLAGVTNKFSGLNFLAPGAVKLEHMLISWIASLFGYPKEHAGNLTSGGSAATLIALVTARDSSGLRPNEYERAVVYLTKDTYNCVHKGMRILGMHDVILRFIDFTNEWQMDPKCLQNQIRSDKKAGLIPFFIAISIGTGNLGSIDPIDKIADVAEEQDVWLHADAAYGGFFILVDGLKHWFKGTERTDSIIIDPHKGLFLPNGIGAIVIRNGRKLYESHKLSGYSNDILQDVEIDEWSPSDLSFELTRPFRGLKMWLTLKLFGVTTFSSALEEKMLLANYFHHKLTEIDGIIAGPKPVLSVVLFHFGARNRSLSDRMSRELMRYILSDGRVYLSSTTLDGIYHLRICVLNFRLHRENIDLLLSIIRVNTEKLRKKNNLKRLKVNDEC